MDTFWDIATMALGKIENSFNRIAWRHNKVLQTTVIRESRTIGHTTLEATYDTRNMKHSNVIQCFIVMHAIKACTHQSNKAESHSLFCIVFYLSSSVISTITHPQCLSNYPIPTPWPSPRMSKSNMRR
jgi:hypothetical protein